MFKQNVDPNNPKCECWDVADQLLTDYTWYCNQRKFLTDGKYSKRRKHPLYATLIARAWTLSPSKFNPKYSSKSSRRLLRSTKVSPPYDKPNPNQRVLLEKQSTE